jgi:sulfatase maturation enzyme AslB (radical SAM superfamily)
MEHGALQNKEISFITKPNPEDVKIKLANLRQLLFEVTDGCNLKCYYCGYGELYNNYDKRLSKKLSYEKVKTVIDYDMLDKVAFEDKKLPQELIAFQVVKKSQRMDVKYVKD